MVALIEPGVIRLSFADGYEALVDLSSTIRRLRSLSALKDWKTFQRVNLDEWSRGVVFDGDDRLSLASDNLRAMSLEQSGEYSHQHVIAWMERHALTLDRAARELGLSRRMLAYYRSGEKAVPRTVGLAMLGWEHLRPSSAARSASLTKGAQTSGSRDLMPR